MLEARFLGKFDIRVDGVPIEIPARKAQSLLAYLVIEQGIQHRREKLAGMLWPDYDESSSRSKLRFALWQLRSALGDQYFLADKISLAFNNEADSWVDCDELGKEAPEEQTTDQLEKEANLYHGEFLPGFYEDWVFLYRDQLRALFENKIALLLRRLSDEKRWRHVVEWGERWISLGGTPEPAFQALMIAHSQLGDISSASNAYLRCEHALKEELEVEPSELTRNIYASILQGDIEEAYVRFSLEKPPHRLKPPPAISEPPPEVKYTPFVAREAELAWLDQKLQLALEGEGQLAFVVGDSGQGKTALLKNFSQRSQEYQQDLVIAYATCEAFSGVGDTYLPFRNILALLTGDVAAKQTTSLINQENALRLWELIPHSMPGLLGGGPDLVDSFVSGEALVRRASSYTLERPDWLVQLEGEVEQRRSRPNPIHIDHGDSERDLFDQYSRVVQNLSQSHPLLLIIDDMQWADLGTLGLLFHLARRIGGHPILILGSYRPSDLDQVRDGHTHPLAGMLPEFKRKFGDIELNLNRMVQDDRRKFVDDYLDSEANDFDEGFRRELFSQTDGQPLFTIELMRQMEEQGSIIKDEQGRWVKNVDLSWDTLPAKVEAVIEGRVNRLPQQLRELLNIASVEGEEFTAEIVAAVAGYEAPDVISHLSQELARRHRLVEVSEIRYVDRQRLSVYRFRHNLFQKYIYEALDIAQKQYLHEEIGSQLEQVFAEDLAQVAVQLAHHYEISGVYGKAVDYLLLAGKQAKRVSANQQAILMLTKGIDLLERLPEGERRTERELALQIALGAPLVATLGYSSQQVEKTFERARKLCEQTGDSSQLAPALWGICAFFQVRGKHEIAHKMANQILRIAESEGGGNLNMLAHWMLGISHTHLGDFSAGREHLELALSLYDSLQDDYLTFLYGQNPRVTCLNYLALNLWMLGYLDQAVEMCQEAVDYAEQISHPYSLTFAHGIAALFHSLRGDAQDTLLHSEQAFKLAKKSGFPFFLALSMLIRGWARIMSGKPGMALKLVENGVEAMQAIGAELAAPYFLSLLAEALGTGGAYDQANQQIETAMAKSESNHELWYESGVNFVWGNLLVLQGASSEDVLSRYWQAIRVAEGQAARSLGLRAAVALVKFDGAGPSTREARRAMEELLQWFKEGLDDPLLLEAEELLKKR